MGGEFMGAAGGASAKMGQAVRVLEQKLAAALGVKDTALPDELKHVLRCCEQDTATVAVDEAVQQLKSGKVKSPVKLVLSTVLRRRRADGGHVWLQRVSGLPLAPAPVQALRALLDALDWGAMPAEGKLRGKMADNSFKLGLSTKEWGSNNGPYAPMAFKEGYGMWDGLTVIKKHKALWDAAAALVKSADPSYQYTSVQFNRNFGGGAGGNLHRDDKDAHFQLATAFGEYTGGELRVYGQEGVVDVNTRDRWVRFDGRFPHEVLPYDVGPGGSRYSVIFFQLAPPWSVDLSSTVDGGD
jgi:hypothetical protein